MSAEIQNVACPLCGITGFSARGLKTHRCRSTADRRRLTSEEYVAACFPKLQPAHPNPQPAKK